MTRLAGGIHMRSRWYALAFAGALGLGVAWAPSIASASPGTCKCNSGCHANPGQCVKGNGCSLGYAPTCGYRSESSGAPVCPKVGYLSCNGTCECVPIPNFCETVGGAEYCDAGPPDTGAPDTYEPPDTYVEDTYVEDTYVEDTYVPPPVDSCVPLACPAGTKGVAVPGECDPFCAQPCGGGEFKCAGLFGTTCVDGFCVPDCLITGCAACQTCGLGDGKCFESGCGEDAGGDGATTTDAAAPGDDTGSSGGDGGSSPGDSTVAPGDASGGASDAQGSAQSPLVDGPVEQDGGCGCRVGARTSSEGLAAAAMGIGALIVARRRRRG